MESALELCRIYPGGQHCLWSTHGLAFSGRKVWISESHRSRAHFRRDCHFRCIGMKRSKLMQYTHITVDYSFRKKIATITLRRPEVHNAFNAQLIQDLTNA